MKIALIQCPAWTTESPPYALALLAAGLEKNGHEVECFDLNIDMYKFLKEHGSPGDSTINNESWAMDFRGNVWYEKKNVSDFINKYNYYLDGFVESVINSSSRIIGFSVQSTSRFFSIEIARRIKEKDKNKIIIFGGPLCFRNCYGIDLLKDNSFLDAVCFGEGEQAFLKLIEIVEAKGGVDLCEGFGCRLNTGIIADGGENRLIDDLNGIPFADYSRFSLEKYTKNLLPISTSRGCIKRCLFCNESVHWRKYRARSAENILSEIEYQLAKFPHIDTFWFNDSLINGDIGMLDELCDLLISRKIKIKWGGQGVVRREMTGRLLEKMKLAGCNVISYGVENGSSKVLGLMQKGQMYSPELAESIMRDTYEIGINVIFNIIVGFPGEGEIEFKETVDFVQRCKKYAAHIEFNTLLLLKDSYLYVNPEEFNISPIDYNSDWQLRWKTEDNLNTYYIRKARLEELTRVINKNTF